MLAGIETDVNDEQRPNAQSPILVTLSGMLIEANDSQSLKALEPIVVKPSDISVTFDVLKPETSRDARLEQL